MPELITLHGNDRLLTIRSFIINLVCLVIISLLPTTTNAESKMQALEMLQNLVNDKTEAKKIRRKVMNASMDERVQYDELRLTLEKEINAISSSLPRKIDNYTTMDAATISGNNIVFKATILDHMDRIEYKNEIMSQMGKMIKNNFCSSPSGAWLLLGYTWSYFYYRENGEYYGGIIIDAKLCGFE
ncbi:MAG: hypothetical protein AB2731_11570 [Candidatus Thiodiazotropha sp.]